MEDIRNFSIVAHIDHGKSTLADRILLRTGAITEREFREQVLDDMDLERERGITIKASAVALTHRQGGKAYRMNLIDTPGHVDFQYEVSRALAACEGAVLLVDATQGVEAQTVANAYKAIDAGLVILPVVNKIDLPGARPDEVAEQMENAFGFRKDEILVVSAKTGEGVDELLAAIVERVPSPKGDPDAPLRALLFDSEYDTFRGVVVYVRVVDGAIGTGQAVHLMGSRGRYEVGEIGRFRPQMTAEERLVTGEVGYCVTGIRDMAEVRIGDTLTDTAGIESNAPPLPGYREPQLMVFCGLYPVDSTDYEKLRDALGRLRLNDASFAYEPETSAALGFGFRCGFLGLLHMEIVRERLERESALELITTAPNVSYEIDLANGETRRVDRPSQIPTDIGILEFREPVVRASVISPSDAIGNIMKLFEESRGEYVRTDYLSPERVILVYDVPLAEIVYDFYDRLKSATRGYGTLDYDPPTFREADLARLDILVAGSPVDALSSVVHRKEAQRRGRALLQRLRKEIPRHLFEVILQAAIGGRILARESIRPMSKNVTSKCYGGDITRKRKLWEKQKAGKKRMKSVGSVEIPQEAFLAVLKTDR